MNKFLLLLILANITACTSTSFYEQKATFVSPWSTGERWSGKFSIGLPGAYEVQTLSDYSSTPPQTKSLIENKSIFNLFPSINLDLAIDNKLDLALFGSNGFGAKYQFIGDKNSKDLAACIQVTSGTSGTSRSNYSTGVKDYEIAVNRTVATLSVGKSLSDSIKVYGSLSHKMINAVTKVYQTTNYNYDDTGYSTQVGAGLITSGVHNEFILEAIAGNADFSRTSSTPVSGLGFQWGYLW